MKFLFLLMLTLLILNSQVMIAQAQETENPKKKHKHAKNWVQPLEENGGRGGGGLQLNGRNYTLSELGLKVDTGSEPYFLDLDTINAVEDLLKKLDDILPTRLKGFLTKAVSDDKHTYQKLSVVDPNLYKNIKAEYQKYISTLPISGNFILAANTDQNGVTSLFPDFFSPSTPRETRAVWIVTHEAIFFLRPQAELKQVLRFEGAVQNYIKNPGDSSTWMPVYDALADLGLLNNGISNWMADIALYIRVLQFQGKKVTMGNLFTPYTQVLNITPSSTSGVTSIRMLQNIGTNGMVLKKGESTIDAEFFKRFYQTRAFQDVGDPYVRDDLSNANTQPESLEVRYCEDHEGRPAIDLVFKKRDGTEFHIKTTGPVEFYPADEIGYGKRFAP